MKISINIVVDSVVVLFDENKYIQLSLFLYTAIKACISRTFIHQKIRIFLSDLKRLVEGSHIIDKKNVTVIRQPPKKKIPLDPLKVHVQGLNETTSEDCIRYYLETCPSVEVTEVYKGYNNNALVSFNTEPGKQH